MSAGWTPLRLSWRFLPVSKQGKTLSEPDWDPRQNLDWSIPPKGSVQATIAPDLPKQHENYVFEISMVLDGVVWFYDLGMNVGRFPLPAR